MILGIYLAGYIGGEVVPPGKEEKIMNQSQPNNNVFNSHIPLVPIRVEDTRCENRNLLTQDLG